MSESGARHHVQVQVHERVRVIGHQAMGSHGHAGPAATIRHDVAIDRNALPNAAARGECGTKAHLDCSRYIAVQRVSPGRSHGACERDEAMNRTRARLVTTRNAALLGERSTLAIAVAAAALVVCAVVNRQLAKRAERHNRPIGRFLDVDGVRLHYLERGQGEPLVLLHGNGSMIQDFEASGLIDMAARRYRVIVFDRPGYGYSERPRGTIWTPAAQAELLHQALAQLGVSRATVLGHSWGASVAVALALKYPEAVSGLVLASGYFYPSVRVDVVAMSQAAIPVIGDILRYTISPFVSRLLWPLAMRRIFGPASVPKKFDEFPKEMAVRPSQLRASAAESFLMIPDAIALRRRYAHLRMPVVIVAGEQDRLVDIDRQSSRLHREVKQSAFRRVRGAGHMVHQTATGEVMSAIDQAAHVAAEAAE
jgi:pimeloyl-ACP methyl ester carboxylesterase